MGLFAEGQDAAALGREGKRPLASSKGMAGLIRPGLPGTSEATPGASSTTDGSEAFGGGIRAATSVDFPAEPVSRRRGALRGGR